MITSQVSKQLITSFSTPIRGPFRNAAPAAELSLNHFEAQAYEVYTAATRIPTTQPANMTNCDAASL